MQLLLLCSCNNIAYLFSIIQHLSYCGSVISPLWQCDNDFVVYIYVVCQLYLVSQKVSAEVPSCEAVVRARIKLCYLFI